MKEQLQEALAAVKIGEEDKARLLLAEFLREEPDYAPAWVLLSKLATSNVQRAAFLRKVLEIEPEHVYATQELARLSGVGPPQINEELAKEAKSAGNGADADAEPLNAETDVELELEASPAEAEVPVAWDVDEQADEVEMAEPGEGLPGAAGDVSEAHEGQAEEDDWLLSQEDELGLTELVEELPEPTGDDVLDFDEDDEQALEELDEVEMVAPAEESLQEMGGRSDSDEAATAIDEDLVPTQETDLDFAAVSEEVAGESDAGAEGAEAEEWLLEQEDDFVTDELSDDDLDWFTPDDDGDIEPLMDDEEEEASLPVSNEPTDYEAQARGDTLPPWMDEAELAAQAEVVDATIATGDDEMEGEDLPEWLQEEPEADWLGAEEDDATDGEEEVGASRPGRDEEARVAETEAKLAAAMAASQKRREAYAQAQEAPAPSNRLVIGLGILAIIVFLLAVYFAATLL